MLLAAMLILGLKIGTFFFLFKCEKAPPALLDYLSALLSNKGPILWK